MNPAWTLWMLFALCGCASHGAVKVRCDNKLLPINVSVGSGVSPGPDAHRTRPGAESVESSVPTSDAEVPHVGR